MTDEEMRRTMQFILEQQALFTTDMQQMREEHARFAAETRQNFGRLGEAVLAITGIVGRLGDAQERTERKVAELADRLNVFIGVVERYITEHRNGDH